MKVLFIKQQNKILFFYLFYPQKENKYTEIATTTKKQSKFKVFCFFHSLPEIYQSWSIILVLFQEQAMINKPACMKSVTLKIWEKMNKLQCSL